MSEPKIKIDCMNVMSHICMSLNEELDSPRCREIKVHLENCEACQSYYKSVEKTIDYYRKYELDLPDGAHNRLMKTLNLDEEENNGKIL